MIRYKKPVLHFQDEPGALFFLLHHNFHLMDASPSTEELRDSQGYVESDNSDFQAPIPMPDDASNKRRMEDSDSEEDEEDVTVCAICQKEWVNNGFHSIAQMKCGHCFGRSYADDDECIIQSTYLVALL